MPFNQALLAAMPDTITVEAFTGRDTAGNETYAAPVTVRANVKRRYSRGQKPSAPENMSGKRPSPDGQIILAPLAIGPNSRITLANGDVVYVDTIETFGDPYAPGTDYIQTIDFVVER